MGRLQAKATLAMVGFVLLTSLASATGSLSFVAGRPFQPALAGSSGQQLDFSDGIGYVSNVAVSGYNQFGSYVSRSFPTPYFDDNYLAGWWWQGYITMDEYGSSSNNLGEEWTTVPSNQSSDWWWYCDYQGGSDSATGGFC